VTHVHFEKWFLHLSWIFPTHLSTFTFLTEKFQHFFAKKVRIKDFLISAIGFAGTRPPAKKHHLLFLLPGGDLSRLGNGERNLAKPKAARPSKWRERVNVSMRAGCFRVSLLVNHAQSDSPECLKPA